MAGISKAVSPRLQGPGYKRRVLMSRAKVMVKDTLAYMLFITLGVGVLLWVMGFWAAVLLLVYISLTGKFW